MDRYFQNLHVERKEKNRDKLSVKGGNSGDGEGWRLVTAGSTTKAPVPCDSSGTEKVKFPVK